MSKMSEEELQTKVFYSLGQAEVSSSEQVLKIGDELMQAIHSYTQEKCREVELHYLEKLLIVYDDINTGVAKKQSNSTFYINKAIHTESEIKHLKAQLNKSKGE